MFQLLEYALYYLVQEDDLLAHWASRSLIFIIPYDYKTVLSLNDSKLINLFSWNTTFHFSQKVWTSNHILCNWQILPFETFCLKMSGVRTKQLHAKTFEFDTFGLFPNRHSCIFYFWTNLPDLYYVRKLLYSQLQSRYFIAYWHEIT